jgi:hypothetical protein
LFINYGKVKGEKSNVLSLLTFHLSLYYSLFALIESQIVYKQRSENIINARISAEFDSDHADINQLKPADFNITLTTPISAPPAINPEAIKVPLSRLALLRDSSLLLVET